MIANNLTPLLIENVRNRCYTVKCFGGHHVIVYTVLPKKKQGHEGLQSESNNVVVYSFFFFFSVLTGFFFNKIKKKRPYPCILHRGLNTIIVKYRDPLKLAPMASEQLRKSLHNFIFSYRFILFKVTEMHRTIGGKKSLLR